MKLSIYQIDAFADKPFAGNPAAIIPLDEWLPDDTMQAIAEENNLSETAFFVPVSKGKEESKGNAFHIRWFTPNKEVSLCGHATLASAYVLFNILGYAHDVIWFDSLSGVLSVIRNGDLLTLDFPTQRAESCAIPAVLAEGLDATPAECLLHEDYLVVFDKEEDVHALKPDNELLMKLDLRGVIATAPSQNYDFIVRFFAPKYGIPEDPVTGSAYTKLTPYWSERLGKHQLTAKQVSLRGGEVFCEMQNDRVLISGKALKYMEGFIDI